MPGEINLINYMIASTIEIVVNGGFLNVAFVGGAVGASLLPPASDDSLRGPEEAWKATARQVLARRPLPK